MVGVCDREPLMAKQLYERFPVKAYFSDLGEMFRQARPDVVHITTPADSHFDLARICIEHGCHVYVEKPFTLTAKDAEALIALTNQKGVKLTVGHDEQFSHVARRMRSVIKSGYLGGDPVHMESYYGYDLGDRNYAAAMMGDKQHWVRRLPGKLLHNLISHGVARIAEFLHTEDPQVIACGFVSPFLTELGETEIIDELRVIVVGEQKMTAYFTFSSQLRPVMHEFRIYGPKAGLILDQDHDTLIRLRGTKFKSFAEKFIPPVIFARQYLYNAAANLKAFAARDFHAKSGMKNLIESFYESIVKETPLPISYREILLTARIMEKIFQQLSSRKPESFVSRDAQARLIRA